MVPRAFGKRSAYPTMPAIDRRLQPPPSHDDSFMMAYQPIVNVTDNRIFAYEALVRGVHGERAATLFANIPEEDRIDFDAACRRQAIRTACSLCMESKLSVNISPEAICTNLNGPMDTLQAAHSLGFRSCNLILEITERSAIPDLQRIRRCLEPLRSEGVLIAIDDFGAGYNGLNTLVSLKPNIVKIDLGLVDGIETCEIRQAVVSSLLDACGRLGILVVAEGVETATQHRVLRGLGVELMQGYLLARPAVGALPSLESAAIAPMLAAKD